VCNIETEPLPDFGHFDAVVMTEVLEHLIDPYRVLREKVVSLLRNDGTLVASVPNCAFLKERLSLLRGLPPTFREGPKDRDSDRYRPYNLYHKTAFTVASFVETLSIAGFEVLFIEQTEGYIPSSMAKPGVQQLWRVLGCMRPNLFLNQVIAKARRRAF
jgi:2-polyprenyl-3-methyl-5-hydroxy-6-metoxy-1,4-benzoquinol methylase